MSNVDEIRNDLVATLMQHPWLKDQNPLNWPKGYCPTCSTVISAGPNSPAHAEHVADALLAAGFRKVETAPESDREALDALVRDTRFIATSRMERGFAKPIPEEAEIIVNAILAAGFSRIPMTPPPV